MQAQTQADYRVVLIFKLQPGTADEEINRSRAEGSFPAKLARQPGFVSMDLVKISDDKTMAVQGWASAEAWWAALSAVKATGGSDNSGPNILIEREFYAGPVLARR
jgi:hypothetical protein